MRTRDAVLAAILIAAANGAVQAMAMERSGARGTGAFEFPLRTISPEAQMGSFLRSEAIGDADVRANLDGFTAPELNRALVAASAAHDPFYVGMHALVNRRLKELRGAFFYRAARENDGIYIPGGSHDFRDYQVLLVVRSTLERAMPHLAPFHRRAFLAFRGNVPKSVRTEYAEASKSVADFHAKNGKLSIEDFLGPLSTDGRIIREFNKMVELAVRYPDLIRTFRRKMWDAFCAALNI